MFVSINDVAKLFTKDHIATVVSNFLNADIELLMKHSMSFSQGRQFFGRSGYKINVEYDLSQVQRTIPYGKNPVFKITVIEGVLAMQHAYIRVSMGNMYAFLRELMAFDLNKIVSPKPTQTEIPKESQTIPKEDKMAKSKFSAMYLVETIDRHKCPLAVASEKSLIKIEGKDIFISGVNEGQKIIFARQKWNELSDGAKNRPRVLSKAFKILESFRSEDLANNFILSHDTQKPVIAPASQKPVTAPAPQKPKPATEPAKKPAKKPVAIKEPFMVPRGTLYANLGQCSIPELSAIDGHDKGVAQVIKLRYSENNSVEIQFKGSSHIYKFFCTNVKFYQEILLDCVKVENAK